MEAWGYVVAVAVGVLISEGIRWFRDWRQGEEKYRLMLYEKRLEAHQKAFYYAVQLYDQLTAELYDFVILHKEVGPLYREAVEFYDSNCLYLDEQSRNEMRLAISGMRLCLEEPDSGLMKNAIDQLLKAKEAIVSGIGMKHIEEPKKEQIESKT